MSARTEKSSAEASEGSAPAGRVQCTTQPTIATAADLHAAIKALEVTWRQGYSRELVERRQRVLAYLAAEIERLGGDATVWTPPPPKVEVVVFRPAPDGRWAMGFADRPRVIGFKYGRRAIEAAHAAISGAGGVYAAAYTREAARRPQNALRSALHGRVADEVALRAGCPPLARAIRSIQVSQGTGLLTYPGLDDVRILATTPDLCAQF